MENIGNEKKVSKNNNGFSLLSNGIILDPKTAANL